MSLPGSGTIRLSEIKTEFGKGNNLLDYLGEGGVTGSAPLKLTDFYGTSASTPPVAEYPGKPINLKKHGHEQGWRDVGNDAVNWAANHIHKITANATSTYECVSLTNQAFTTTAEAVFLVDYKIRMKGDNDVGSAPYSYVNPSTTTAESIQTQWTNGVPDSIPRSYTRDKQPACWISSSTSPSRMSDEIPEDQLLLEPELRAYNLYQHFEQSVRKTGSGEFGQNETVRLASWTESHPYGNSAGEEGNRTWRTAEGQMYITLPAGTWRTGMSTRLAKARESTYRSGMEVRLDKLVFTPITEEEHEAL